MLQHFGKMRYNSVIPENFAEVVTVMNLIEQSDAMLASYYPSTTCWICLYGL